MGNCRNLFLSGCSISFSSETDVGFSCLTSSSVFHIVRLLNFNHSCEYAVLSHEILICIFLMTNMKLIFYVFICHLCIFIGKGSVQIICPYFFVGGDVLDINHLSAMHFANIFLQSVVCLFISLTVSFEGQKFFISKKPNLSTFWMVCSVTSKKKICLNKGHKAFLLIVLSQ